MGLERKGALLCILCRVGLRAVSVVVAGACTVQGDDLAGCKPSVKHVASGRSSSGSNDEPFKPDDNELRGWRGRVGGCGCVKDKSND